MNEEALFEWMDATDDDPTRRKGWISPLCRRPTSCVVVVVVVVIVPTNVGDDEKCKRG